MKSFKVSGVCVRENVWEGERQRGREGRREEGERERERK